LHVTDSGTRGDGARLIIADRGLFDILTAEERNSEERVKAIETALARVEDLISACPIKIHPPTLNGIVQQTMKRHRIIHSHESQLRRLAEDLMNRGIRPADLMTHPDMIKAEKDIGSWIKTSKAEADALVKLRDEVAEAVEEILGSKI